MTAPRLSPPSDLDQVYRSWRASKRPRSNGSARRRARERYLSTLTTAAQRLEVRLAEEALRELAAFLAAAKGARQ